jgi:hypothetical protein
MVKKACYIILPNPFLYEKYGEKTDGVFTNDELKWTKVEYVSGFWDMFEDHYKFDYDGVIRKIRHITKELSKSSCEYNLDRHKFFCEILYNMKRGETVFVKYEDQVKLLLSDHLKEKYNL